MTPQEAINYFGGRISLSKVCRVTQTAVHHWVKQGFIPYDKQCLIQVEIERLPKKGRRLVASRNDIPQVARA